MFVQVNAVGLKAVVAFCYNGSVSGVSGENVAAMISASQRLQVSLMQIHSVP